MDLVTTTALADDLALEVWAYDRSALHIWGPGVPPTRDALNEVKRSELAPDDRHLRTITRPAVLLEALVQDRQRHPAAGASAVILTDGDAEVADDQPRLIAAARELGKDPAFRLAVIDIKPEDRKMWDGALGLGMPGRYVLAGTSEAQDKLTSFLKGSKAL